MDETTLIRAAQAGDRSALRELYEQNRQKVFGLAFQYAGNREDAEDILQETFIKAFNNIRTFRTEEEIRFAPWLFRVGVNCSIDYLRRNKARRAEMGEAALAAVASESPGSDPQSESARREFHGRLERTLSTLSPKQRMIFLLKHEQQLSIKEIATQLRCSEGSVKTHLFRAVAAVRRNFRTPAMEGMS